MNPLIQVKKAIPLFVVTLLVTCFGLMPQAQAVTPPPDGGYPNFTTAEGLNALKNLTTGAGNTGVGWYSLFSDTAASFNTGVGAGTLALNTADNNTAVGAAALLLNTTGVSNTGIGSTALLHNNGGNNTGVGAGALTSNTTGNANTAIGVGALGGNTNGGGNTATGFLALSANNGALNTATGLAALQSNTTGGNNTAVGSGALNFNTIGHENTAVGQIALQNNIDGTFNSAFGQGALATNSAGSNNTASGAGALFSNDTGALNTATGFQALNGNTIGGGNTATGYGALFNNSAGNDNTAFGFQALHNSVASGNLAIGINAGLNVTNASNVICIGSFGSNVSNSCFIGNIRGVQTTNGDAIPVLIDSAGQLGTLSSSRRFKEEINPMDKASEAILALKPVSFHYKSDNTNTAQFGLIAEEVAAVNPDLVVRDKAGEIYTVRYDAVNAMLLNEFLKEHKKVEEQAREMHEQQTTIAELKSTVTRQEVNFQSKLAAQEKQIEALALGLQKVSAQLEVKKPAPQMVSNNP
jgi:hypothetical protein